MMQSRKSSFRELKKPKGLSFKIKTKTEYQKSRDKQQKRGLAIFD